MRGLASWSGALVGPGRTIFELTQKTGLFTLLLSGYNFFYSWRFVLKTWPLKSAQGIEPLPSNVQKNHSGFKKSIC